MCVRGQMHSIRCTQSVQFLRNLIKKELDPTRKLGRSGGDSKPLSVVCGSSMRPPRSPNVARNTLNISSSGATDPRVDGTNTQKSPAVEKQGPLGHTRSHSMQARHNSGILPKESEVEGLDKGVKGKLTTSDSVKTTTDNKELVADLLALNSSECEAILPSTHQALSLPPRQR